ncbi:MAG: adenosylcobinamide-phosphate synthase CbiB [Methanocorpusculum sp.]|nr:adenosylcobinamide-phosphate synthase CbiB [Methanocorpusculum sp.]
MAFGSIILFLGLILDRIIGDPRSRFHPVALLGNLIGLWGRINFYPKGFERFAGVVGWIFTVAVALLPCVLIYAFAPGWVFVIFSVVALSFCVGWKSLEQHVFAVEGALKSGDEEEARRKVQYMVSRDTKSLTFEQIRSGAYESAAENLVDSIIAPLFWFVAFELLFGAGIFGAVLFRCANTMDAMLGYKDERVRLGWFSARADDVFAFLPARVAGAVLILIFACTGRFKKAAFVFKSDRKKRPGFNGGIPMSLIAGGCGVCFDKPNVYKIGVPEISLEEGGRKIIFVMRAAVVICAVLGVALIGIFEFGELMVFATGLGF